MRILSAQPPKTHLYVTYKSSQIELAECFPAYIASFAHTHHCAQTAQDENSFQLNRIAIDNFSGYTAAMASLRNAHRQLNQSAPAGNSAASLDVSSSFYYYYAHQAMLEVRSSGE